MAASSQATLPFAALGAAALLPWSAAAGCSGAADVPGDGNPTGVVRAPILDGTSASAYPEAALVDMTQSGSNYRGFCSAALIAPQVVLTAGHCIKGVATLIPDTWQVTLPYNGNQQFTSNSAETFDWVTTDSNVNMNTHDIGLVFLPTPASIAPDQCPALATMPVADNTQVVNIGRIQSGTLSMTDLFVGAPVSVTASQFYPFDYQSTDIIEEGDSGGPDEVPGSTPHLIVAVNSGAGTSQQVLARVDLLNDVANGWIMQMVMAHGGPCTPSPSPGGSSGSANGGGSGSTSGGNSGGTGSTGGGNGGSASGGSSTGGNSSGSSDAEGPDGGAASTDGNNGRTAAGCACDTAGAERGTPNALAVVGLATLALAGGAAARRRRRV